MAPTPTAHTLAMAVAAAAAPAAPMVSRSSGPGAKATPCTAALDLEAPRRCRDAAPSPPASASDGGVRATVKWLVLAFLVFQNSGASLLMRCSRSTAQDWNSQTAVIAQEAVKGLLCAGLVLRSGGLRALREALSPSAETAKTAVPAILYLVQNNMQYVAVGYLDAATYSVLYQFKILTTALLSVAILGKRLALPQWLALCVLTVGASAVVLAELAPASAAPREVHVLPGVAAVLMACCTSGLAGVYFEKLLKGSTVSLWARNLQLALYSLAIGFATLHQNGTVVLGQNFFHGYTPVVWSAIINNALGGLLIAVVIKYADNILKNFSTTLSIVVTTAVSTAWLGAPITPLSALGTSMVVYAVFLYGGLSGASTVRPLPGLAARALGLDGCRRRCCRRRWGRGDKEAEEAEAGSLFARRAAEDGGA